MNNKKGMTLVEVIAALAVFSIVIVTISGIFTESIRNMQKSKIKLDVVNLAQGIAETIKSIKVDEVENYIKEKNLNSSGVFIYFNDDYKDLVVHSDDDKIIENNDKLSIITWISKKDKDFLSKYAKVDNPYSQCKNFNNMNRKYGSYISINKETLSDEGVESYDVKVRVWDLFSGNESEESLKEISISR